MSNNPKVFEFAKEVGMTPLALMDKIREWQLPVKSHMAELEPEVLEQIKVKLGGQGGSSEKAEIKAKKAVKKAAPKKSAEPPQAPAPAPSKTPVIRRKAQAADEVSPQNESHLKSAQSHDGHVEEESAEIRDAATESTAEVEVVQTSKGADAAVGEAATVVETVAKPVTMSPPTSPEPVVSEEVKAAPVAQPVVVPSRKKEVVVGTSGVQSTATPLTTAPKRNIVGRMDLSRVSQMAPRPGVGGPRQGGYEGRSSGGYAGGSSTGTGPKPGGFSSQRTNVNRNIRTGFVSAPTMPPPETPEDADQHARDYEKKAKRLAGGAGAKEREEEVEDFNAVEFRKREMVFQPRKKKGSLDREAMKTQITTPKAHKRIVKIHGAMKLCDLAQEIGVKAPQLIKILVGQGVVASMNTDLDFDTIALIVPEFGWEAQNVKKTAEELVTELAGDSSEATEDRPPVVTVMGHVDHGKTSLLDAIRNADVAAGEAGGITQHIGAYSVKLEDGHLITFLDTPGHEAFTAMRARGANATDVAVIVVAADDGMMPQTQEAISHAKAAGVPIIVAINKMDKPGANPEKIKQQLTEMEIVPEEWGGSTIFCPVSALKKSGIKELLESIKLQAEMLNLKANSGRAGTGIVIESKMEKGRGPVATLLVRDGTIKVGQYIVAGMQKGKVRSLMNDRGERVQFAGPGIPVEVLGLEAVPAAGDRFDIVADEDAANRVAALRVDLKNKENAQPTQKLSLEEIFSKVQKGDVKELGIVLKADVHGSLEAIQGMIAKLSTQEVKTRIIHSAVGGISETDILLAQTAKGIVVGFNVRPDGGAQAKAKQLGVDVRTYSIVYELVDELKKAMSGLLTPDIVEKVMGRLEVRNVFNVPKIGAIAGCFVSDGKVQRSNMIRLVRDGKIVYEGKISSLKRFKDDAREVATGYECGVGIENFNDVKVGDVMEAYIKEEIARELTPEVRP